MCQVFNCFKLELSWAVGENIQLVWVSLTEFNALHHTGYGVKGRAVRSPDDGSSSSSGSTIYSNTNRRERRESLKIGDGKWLYSP